MDNPYQPPLDAPIPDDVYVGRPLGVSILSVLTGILGLLLLTLYIFLLSNWREHNEHFLQRKMPPSLFWVMTGLTVALALASSVGMWRGTKWSWWIVCSVWVLYVLGDVVTAASLSWALYRAGFDPASLGKLIRSLVSGVLFVLLLRYWLGIRVRRYFEFEQAGGIKAILLAGLSGVGIVAAITVVLFIISMIQMRNGF